MKAQLIALEPWARRLGLRGAVTARRRPMSMGQRSEWVGQPCGGCGNIRVKASDSPTAALLILAFAQQPSDLLLGQGGGPKPLFGRPRI